MKSKLLATITIMICLNSCSKLPFEKDMASTDPLVNFEYLWDQVDQKYAYFTLKNIDWDSIKRDYQPLISKDMAQDSLFSVLGSMLNELKDDHTNLISPFNISRYNVSIKGDDNMEYRIVQKHYLREQEYTTGGFKHGFMADNTIGYLRYSSFADNVTNYHMAYILNRYRDTKGIVIDIRENGGGNITNISKILSFFTAEKKLVMYNRTRNGRGRDDFGPYEPYHIEPSGSIHTYTKPVVVLIDRSSYSASTFFALASKAMDNFTLVGDKTGGGGGLPNGGQLPNGWRYRFSISQSYDLDKINYSEEGVEPEHYITLDWSDLTRDEILDFAISYLTN